MLTVASEVSFGLTQGFIDNENIYTSNFWTGVSKLERYCKQQNVADSGQTKGRKCFSSCHKSLWKWPQLLK